MIDERDDLITAEEAVEEVRDEQVTEQVDEEQVEDETVQRAKKYGHLSREEWEAQGRDPDQWKSPEEFDKTGKILDQLYSMRKKLDQRDREIQSLVEYQERTSQREYERAKQDLEQRLQASKDDMDMEGVSHYTKELSRLEDREQQNQQQSVQQAHQEALQGFQQRNQHWFNDQNPDLKQRAIAIDQELKSIYPNATFDELAQKIEMRMQYEYPERVDGHAKPRPSMSQSQSSVNKSTTEKTSTSKTFRNLPQDLKDTYHATKRIIETRRGEEYSVNEFIEQLKRDGEL